MARPGPLPEDNARCYRPGAAELKLVPSL